MMEPCPWPIEDLLPHRAPLLLLDRGVAFTPLRFIAEVTPGSAHPLAGEHGVPAHVGLELMAQTCGAHTGARAQATGEPVRMGVLLGTRRYQAFTDWFAFGQRLTITVQVALLEPPMGVYDCIIQQGDVTLAEASLSVYQPVSPETLLPTARTLLDV